MNRLVASQKEKDSKHMKDLHIQSLRKKQSEYMGLSDDSLYDDYDIMRMNSKISTSRSLPPIYSEVKKAKKPKKRTQSKKRANKRNSQKKKKTPKNN